VDDAVVHGSREDMKARTERIIGLGSAVGGGDWSFWMERRDCRPKLPLHRVRWRAFSL